MAFSEEGQGPNDGPADDSVGFSGPGAPDISNPTSGGYHYMPEFFVEGGNIDTNPPDDDPNSTSMSRIESPRGHAMREDALAAFGDTGISEQTAPKV